MAEILVRVGSYRWVVTATVPRSEVAATLASLQVKNPGFDFKAGEPVG